MLSMDAWVFIVFSILIGVAVKLLLASTTTTEKKRRLPPGPPALPFLARFFLLRKSIFDIELLLRQLRTRYGPVITLPLGSLPVIFISDHTLVHQALVQQGAAFAHRLPASEAERVISTNQCSINTAPYGHRWRLLRRNLTAEILHPSRIKHFAPARRWVLDILVDKLRAQAEVGDGVVVVYEVFQYAMFCLLLLMCFGEKLNESTVRDIEAVQRYLLVLFPNLDVFIYLPRLAKLVFRQRWNDLLAVRKKLEALLIPHIRTRRERVPSEKSFVYCYVDSLLELRLPEEEGRPRLSEEEIVSLCSEFLSAGTDTTATALQWIMANLVKHREMQEKLAKEIEQVLEKQNKENIEEDDLQLMPYLNALVLEGLRRHPPAHFLLPHTVTEDVSFNGYVIPKGAMVNVQVAEMGWDGSVWAEPMEFKPERFMAGGEGEGIDILGSREIKMMPFGAGRRGCPGYALAMQHLEYFVANLVREFEWRAVEGEDVDLEEKLDFTVVMKKPLRATISPRRSKW